MNDLDDLISMVALITVGVIVITIITCCAVSDTILQSQPRFDGFVDDKRVSFNPFGSERTFYIKVQYAVSGKKKVRYFVSEYRVSYSEYNGIEIGSGVEFDENNKPIWNVPT